MTSFATHEAATPTALDARVRKAWGAYREALAPLDGVAYDEAERAEWQDLQSVLGEIAAERAAAEAGPQADPTR